jgi:rRNA-processing protein FCF1
MKKPDSTRLEQIYPNALDALNFKLKHLHEIIENCLFVVDTNTLLLPYDTETKSLAEIKRIYERLTLNKRLYVPEHVLREFMINRSEKHTQLYEALHKAHSQGKGFKPTHVAAFEDDADYKNLKEIEEKIEAQFKERQASLERLKTKASRWYVSDPIQDVYREVFKEAQIIRPNKTYQEIMEELERRNSQKIPPGFSDKNKPLNPEGDLIIWLSMLELGKTKNADVIFISNDTKRDWWVTSGNDLLYPRLELLQEYHREISGKNFLALSLSELLKMFGVNSEIVNDVKSSEVLAAQLLLGSINHSYPDWDSYYFDISIRPRLTNLNIFDVEAVLLRNLRGRLEIPDYEHQDLGVEIGLIPQGDYGTQPRLVLAVQIKNNTTIDEGELESLLRGTLQELYGEREMYFQSLQPSQAMFERYAYDKETHYRNMGWGD